MITSYTFGQMSIGPDIYTADLIICPDRETPAQLAQKTGPYTGTCGFNISTEKKAGSDHCRHRRQ